MQFWLHENRKSPSQQINLWIVLKTLELCMVKITRFVKQIGKANLKVVFKKNANYLDSRQTGKLNEIN